MYNLLALGSKEPKHIDFSAFVHNFVYKMLSHVGHVFNLWKI